MRKDLTDVSADTLVSMLSDKNPINVCSAVCEITRRTQHSPIEQTELVKLKNNKDSFWNNYIISDFAEAALDILGWIKYKGNRKEVKNLIESKLVF
ncbi:MAG: hypothetical protein IKO61_06910 [Lachnospiraceae bacterium]|nr:hypothetical protein [Lachnospiraceae bacterium]